MSRGDTLTRSLKMQRKLGKGRWTLKELAKEFNVTTRTIRRDIDVLKRAGLHVKSFRVDDNFPMLYWMEVE
jgi:predicted DNA-binding transcriptional regulator YafY